MSVIERADETAQFGFDRRLIRHLLADPFGRLIQNFPQHGGIPAQSSGRSDAIQHLFEELTDLLTLYRRSFGLRFGSFRVMT